MFILKIVFAILLVFIYILIGAIMYKLYEMDSDGYGIVLSVMLLWPVVLIVAFCMYGLEFFSHKIIGFYLPIAEKILKLFGRGGK